MKVMLDAMRAKLAEEKHSGMLVAHKGDFELHDRSEIQEFATPMSEYLWFVRPTGTWLARLYVHQTEHDRVDAAMSVHSPHQQWPMFHVSSSGCHEVGVSEIRRLTRRMDYKVLGDAVLYRGESIAIVQIQRVTEDSRSPVSVNFLSSGDLPLEQLSALRTIGFGEVVRRFGVFCGVESMLLDGSRLVDAISGRKSDLELAIG